MYNAWNMQPPAVQGAAGGSATNTMSLGGDQAAASKDAVPRPVRPEAHPPACYQQETSLPIPERVPWDASGHGQLPLAGGTWAPLAGHGAPHSMAPPVQQSKSSAPQASGWVAPASGWDWVPPLRHWEQHHYGRWQVKGCKREPWRTKVPCFLR